jgi:hypothetical protein
MTQSIDGDLLGLREQLADLTHRLVDRRRADGSSRSMHDSEDFLRQNAIFASDGFGRPPEATPMQAVMVRDALLNLEAIAHAA